MSGGACGGHDGLTADLRALATAALERLEPAVERLRAAPSAGPVAQGPATCAVCPLCAVLAVLRGERPELAVRLAEQAGGLIALLRAALAEPQGPAEPAPPPGTTPSRTVQRIPVTRCR